MAQALDQNQKKEVFDFWVNEANKHLKTFTCKNKTRLNNPNDYKEAMSSLEKMNYCFMKAVGISTKEANFLLKEFRNLNSNYKKPYKKQVPNVDWYDEYLQESKSHTLAEYEKNNRCYRCRAFARRAYRLSWQRKARLRVLLRRM